MNKSNEKLDISKLYQKMCDDDNYHIIRALYKEKHLVYIMFIHEDEPSKRHEFKFDNGEVSSYIAHEGY